MHCSIESRYTLTIPFRAAVYPTPRSGAGNLVSGRGMWTLNFTPTAEANHLKITFNQLWFRFDPSSRLEFDIDGDGDLEFIDLGNFTVTSDEFNMENSGGEVNMDTGEAHLHLDFTITPSSLSQLANLKNLDPIRFTLDENGHIDQECGIFETHSQLWTVPEGTFAGMTIINCMHLLIPYETQPCATVVIGVNVLSGSPSAYDIPAGQAPKEVWICPRTLINLLWDSTNKGTWTVRISPILGDQNPKGHQFIPDTKSAIPEIQKSITQSKTFVARTVGGDYYPAEDSVTINVVNNGDEISQTAMYDAELHYWKAFLPDHTYDRNIRVSEVIIDSGMADSITWPGWRVDHTYGAEKPVNTQVQALNQWVNVNPVHSLAGEYTFRPQPSGSTLPAGEQQRVVYFRLRLGCK
jgi:hypothetical protein